ncbi:alanine--tRNA ligase [Nafulsella turpanensis]|uniref:alanine--tRNA ligase n=1 Tax=Nafulsella turpanensis TaxID=1265690 RepID=UPI0004781760|nr:alanine--tRNA ligase [Nafulsella turpanensis]
MDSKQIRSTFLEFFQSKQHRIVPSAPMVNKDDPTLMFTNAGMNQFKDYFLGNKKADFTRVADTQKCLRVSGKHNDLEEVGIDTYHHTMFEMLGNWSFGDYFKEEAIQWAWELLTEHFKLPKDRLYVTVFEGDTDDNLSPDEEAFKLWSRILPEDRIIYASKKDNFWEMGDTGPCGPCSEIHVDLRSEKEVAETPGRELVNNDHPQVVEIWNLVFIQFNRMANGSLQPLPDKHVDTGMGFERLAMAIQGKRSNYDTDVFQPLIQQVAKDAGIAYGKAEETDIAMRVMVDHIRAIAFAIADGQLPSNTGAGYVIRRILRRAVRYAFTFLNLKEPYLYRLVAVLNEQMGEFFPELKAQEAFISKVIQEEEAAFLRTLETGLRRLNELISSGSKAISGPVAFELYDTFGFPLDLTGLIARENGLTVDEKGFSAEMQKQKERSKKAAVTEAGDWVAVKGGSEKVDFVGYTQLEAKARIVKYREVKEKNKTNYQLVLDKTPFYAESGGQVGDTGYLTDGKEKIRIIDTKKENDLIVHFAERLPQQPEAEFTAVVDADKRRYTQNNHTATHLLHAALRKVLGEHVQQKGSLVNEQLLRFDFSHFAKVTDEELKKVEEMVNERIRQNIQLLEECDVALEEAKKKGAMALFGEKYGDTVRVISFDPAYSVELCGGTHVTATGQIGLFKIVSEGSVSAGVRRIEAVTARAAEEMVREQQENIEQLKALLKNPKDLTAAVQGLLDERNKLAKELEKVQQQQAGELRKELAAKVQETDGIQLLIERVSLPSADALKTISFELKNQFDRLLMVLAADIDHKPQISVVVAEALIQEKGLHAGNLVRELAKEIKGGGGGQPFFATAGGKDINGLDKVIEKAKLIAKQ